MVPQRMLCRIITRHPRLVRHLHRSSAWAARKTLQPFKLADIGEGITECEVIKWNVKPSAVVQIFDPLCEVQSDKASVEITSPFEGIVKELLVKEGEVAKVGENLCIIEVEDETATSEQHDEPASIEPELELEAKAKPADFDHPAAHTTKSEKKSSILHPLDPRSKAVVHQAPVADVLALPSVRHFANQNGVDLSVLAPGSGKGGRIEKRDVENYLSRLQSSASSSSQTSTTLNIESDVVVELGRTRHAMWKAMVKSLEIPHFGYSTYIDLTELHNMLPRLNSYIPTHYLQDPPSAKPLAVNPSSLYPVPPPPDVPPTGKYSRLTYLPFILKTLSRAMQEWPLFRSSVTPSSISTSPDSSPSPSSSSSKPTLTIRPHSDISIALSTPTGLYTPTIQRANTQSIYSLASRLSHFSSLGRRTPCGLTPSDLPRSGGTLTVSNVGSIGSGEFAHPVLVPGGGVAIVAIGRAKWVLDEERGGERRFKVGVSWSADHRIIEGAELAAFVECWRGYIENPVKLIADSI